MIGPKILPSGAVMQSGLAPARLRPPRAHGMLLRGVVVATYVTDDPLNPDNLPDTAATAVYCDVLLYSSQAGTMVSLLPKCLVSQARAGIQSGDIWRPRAATMDISGLPLSLSHSNPQNLDGDHVLIGFMDDSATSPVILRALPHPRTDVGQGQAEPSDGQAVKLKMVDGSPDLRKHLGSVYGVSATADFVVRTTYANKGTLTASGAPPAPPADGSVGNVLLQLHSRAQRLTQLLDMDSPEAPTEVLRELVTMTRWQLEFLSSAANVQISDAGGNTLTAKGSADWATLQIGDGSKHAAIVEHLQALYGQLKTQFDSHLHGSALGPTATASASGFVAPGWDASINSTKVSFPDG